MPKAKWVDLEKFERWYRFLNKIRAFVAVWGGPISAGLHICQLLIEVCWVLFLMGLKDSGVISYGSGNVLV